MKSLRRLRKIAGKHTGSIEAEKISQEYRDKTAMSILLYYKEERATAMRLFRQQLSEVLAESSMTFEDNRVLSNILKEVAGAFSTCSDLCEQHQEVLRGILRYSPDQISENMIEYELFTRTQNLSENDKESLKQRQPNNPGDIASNDLSLSEDDSDSLTQTEPRLLLYPRCILQIISVIKEYHERSAKLIADKIPTVMSHIDELNSGPVFGVPLPDHLASCKRMLASVIEICSLVILKRGTSEEGIFRLSGNATKVAKLQAAFDSGCVISSDLVDDVHVVASTLKKYLRDLPEPLFTSALIPKWHKCSSLPKNLRSLEVSILLKELPAFAYHNLRFMMHVLRKMSEYSTETRMTPHLLSIVIAPSLLWTTDGPGNPTASQCMDASQNYIDLIEMLIENCDSLFEGEVLFDFEAIDEQTICWRACHESRQEHAFKRKPSLQMNRPCSLSRSTDNVKSGLSESVSNIAGRCKSFCLRKVRK